MLLQLLVNSGPELNNRLKRMYIFTAQYLLAADNNACHMIQVGTYVHCTNTEYR